MLLRIEREQRPTHLCVVFDAPGENFRNEIYAEYKAHRPPMPPELAGQLALVHTVIEAFGIATLEVPGFEADDVIATVAKIGGRRRHGGRDLLVGQGSPAAVHGDVTVLDTMKNRRLGPAEVQGEVRRRPRRRSATCWRSWATASTTCRASTASGPRPPPSSSTSSARSTRSWSTRARSRASGARRWRRARDLVRTSRELVRLREDVPLPKTLEELHRVEPDRERLRALFRELEFSRLDRAALARGRGRDRAARRSREAPSARRGPRPCPRRSRPSRRRPTRASILDRAGLGDAGARRSRRRARSAWRRSSTARRPCAPIWWGSASRSRTARTRRQSASTSPSATATSARPPACPRPRCSRRSVRSWRPRRSPSTRTTPRRSRSCCAGAATCSPAWPPTP